MCCGRAACKRIWSANCRFTVTERAEQLQAGGMSEEEAVRRARPPVRNYTTQVERTRENGHQ